nr:MAG TPA: hypothetical protein [Caudoviricetes sp.]
MIFTYGSYVMTMSIQILYIWRIEFYRRGAKSQLL